MDVLNPGDVLLGHLVSVSDAVAVERLQELLHPLDAHRRELGPGQVDKVLPPLVFKQLLQAHEIGLEQTE